MSDTGDHPNAVDVAIIGAGPAGAVAAYHLARAGRSVLVLERRSLPRFHVGESQVPYASELIREMGLWPAILRVGYPLKRGAEFIFPDGDFRRTDFSDQGAGRQPVAIEVERGHFDHLLVQHAVRAGARLLERAVVDELLVERDRIVGLRYETADGVHELRAGHVLDAGGRAAKTAKMFRTRRSISWLHNVAVFRHYTGLDERSNPGHAGDIQVGGHPDGWVWAIPIWRDVISVGAVMSADALKATASPVVALDQHIRRVPRIVARLAGTRPEEETHVESDYCYYSDVVTGPGWTMAGDAGHFIDPIFSGGAFLAMLSGREAARSVDALLRRPDLEQQIQSDYARLYKTGYDTYTRLISAYYESEYRLGSYLHQRGFAIEGDAHFARILSGDFWSDNNPLGEWLRAQERWDTFAPYERVTTCPVYPRIDALERTPVLPVLV